MYFAYYDQLTWQIRTIITKLVNLNEHVSELVLENKNMTCLYFLLFEDYAISGAPKVLARTKEEDGIWHIFTPTAGSVLCGHAATLVLHHRDEDEEHSNKGQAQNHRQ